MSKKDDLRDKKIQEHTNELNRLRQEIEELQRQKDELRTIVEELRAESKSTNSITLKIMEKCNSVWKDMDTCVALLTDRFVCYMYIYVLFCIILANKLLSSENENTKTFL